MSDNLLLFQLQKTVTVLDTMTSFTFSPSKLHKKKLSHIKTNAGLGKVFSSLLGTVQYCDGQCAKWTQTPLLQRKLCITEETCE